MRKLNAPTFLSMTLFILLQVVSSHARLAPEVPAFWMSSAQDSRLTIMAGGGFTSLEIDTTRVDAHGALQYGLNDKFSFTLVFPYRMETHLNDSKAGQRDLIAGLRYRHQLKEHLWIGMSETVSVTSAFKTKLEGFDNWGHSVPQYETRFHLGGRTLRSPLVHNLRFELNAGLRTDAHLENTVIQWDGQFELDIWKNRIRISTEFGQEMRTDNKEFDHQLQASVSGALPWNVRIGAGVVQTNYRDLSPFGVQFFLGWTHQMKQAIIRTRHRLIPSLASILEVKNRVPVFTLEPSTIEENSLADAGRLPFLPLTVAILPVTSSKSVLMEETFFSYLALEMTKDTLVHVISEKNINFAFENLGLQPDGPIEESILDELATVLDADILVQTISLDRDVNLNHRHFLLLRSTTLNAEISSNLRVFIPGSTGFLPMQRHTWTGNGPGKFVWRPVDSLTKNPVQQAKLVDSLLRRATKDLRHNLFYHAETVQEDPDEN